MESGGRAFTRHPRGPRWGWVFTKVTAGWNKEALKREAWGGGGGAASMSGLQAGLATPHFADSEGSWRGGQGTGALKGESVLLAGTFSQREDTSLREA